MIITGLQRRGMTAVPAGKRVIDRLSELLERGRAGRDQDPAPAGSQVTGVPAADQLRRDRQMSAPHANLPIYRPAGRPLVGQSAAHVASAFPVLAVQHHPARSPPLGAIQSRHDLAGARTGYAVQPRNSVAVAVMRVSGR